MLIGGFVGAIFGVINAKMEVYTRRIQLIENVLPMCSECKKIRIEHFEQGIVEWLPIEKYISLKSEAKVRHDFCPDCYEKATW